MIEIIIEDHLEYLQPSELFLTELKTVLEQILLEYKQDYRVCSLFFCSDKFIHNLNKIYRKKDYPTDVLSFSINEGEIFPETITDMPLGDIIISLETAKKQAKEFQVSYEEEIARLTIHGLLHLLGFDHEINEEEHKKMFDIQDKLMDRFMLSYNGKNSSHI
ncbi:MAG: rRNA maturation RNase YbeY [Brevinemataceae bacterium]